jgi:hypothetical protein
MLLLYRFPFPVFRLTINDKRNETKLILLYVVSRLGKGNRRRL